MSFNNDRVPFAATAFASVLFSSSGVLNVILYMATRPKLLPNRRDTAITLNSPTRDWQKQTMGREHRRGESQEDSWEGPPRMGLDIPGKLSLTDIASVEPAARHFRTPPSPPTGSFLDPLYKV